MTEKNIYYYSAFAAANYGFKIAQTIDGKEIKFTGFIEESNYSNYDWSDKKIVGIFNSKELTILNNISPKSNREQLEEYLNLLNKDKTLKQIEQESYQHTLNLIEQERLDKKQELGAKISALRAIYNTCNPLPSYKNK